jgi:hypothetical protein
MTDAPDSKPVQPEDALLAEAAPAPRQRSRWETAWRELRRAPLSAQIGLIVIVCYIILGVFAPVIAPYPENELVGSQYEPWSDEFVFGTDQLGRDMLSRLIFGARNTIGIAFVTTILAFAIGGSLGLLASILGGWADQALGRAVDVLMVPAEPGRVHERRRHGFRRGGAPARRRPGLDHDARDSAQHHAAAGGRVRPALLLCLSDD